MRVGDVDDKEQVVTIYGVTADDETILRLWFDNKVNFTLKAGKVAFRFFDAKTLEKFVNLCELLRIGKRQGGAK